ncbi:Cell differentiation protein rcd1 [Smittium mucronatum]|uniref:Cell differentiation protein rcd1 n=2 Tax=Smittium TaxID=4888 RepID=A0A1R0GQH3_9FUNG|nr:Cell differentiation protein rcd1 [Smittium mucronatum]
MSNQSAPNGSNNFQNIMNGQSLKQTNFGVSSQKPQQNASQRLSSLGPQNFSRQNSEHRNQSSVAIPKFNQSQQNHSLMFTSGNAGQQNNLNSGTELESMYQNLLYLFNPTSKEYGLAELSKRRDQHPELALVLWNSYGVMTILYQEVISVYPLLSPPTLNAQQSNRVCNALALLQMIATHEKTRIPFLKANIPQLLYPLLSTSNKTKPFDNLRLTSLGVIGALYDNPEVISFFFSTEFLPLCLKIMDIGSELCKVIATFIFQKIIADPGGFHYVTSHSKRLKTVVMILNNVVSQLVESRSVRLLKSVTKCYLRLADDPT